VTSPLDTPVLSRRERSRLARDAFPPMGIYAIRNKQTGSIKVKSSRNVVGTLNRIQFGLRHGTYPDKTLQRAWNEGGDDAVTIDILELLKERPDPAFDYAGELKLLEQLYQDDLEPRKEPA
jgi:hypothetical protein